MHKPFIFFGTPSVASETLQILLSHGYTPALVVSAPDSPQGRGLVLTPSPVTILATEHSIPVLTPEKIDDEVLATLQRVGAQYALVVAYGKILPQALIDLFPLGVLNVHYSLLPKYRGASPVEAALLNNDPTTGVAIQRMVFDLDAGDILALEKTPIDPNETALELRPRLITIGGELLARVLPSFEDGTATYTPQDHALATRCRKIPKEARELDISGDAQENWNKYRAYAEGPGTHFFLEKDGKRMRVKIKRARLENGRFVIERVVPEGRKETDFENL